MNCVSFERWLDSGMPQEQSARMLAHAAECARCARALAAARAVENALAADAPAAPALSLDFTDSVMARVEVMPQAAPLREPPALVRIAREPALIAGVLFAALVIWKFGAIESAVRLGWGRVTGLSNPAGALGSSVVTTLATFDWIAQVHRVPGGDVALITLALTLVAPASWWLFAASQRWVAPPRMRTR